MFHMPHRKRRSPSISTPKAPDGEMEANPAGDPNEQTARLVKLTEQFQTLEKDYRIFSKKCKASVHLEEFEGMLYELDSDVDINTVLNSVKLAVHAIKEGRDAASRTRLGKVEKFFEATVPIARTFVGTARDIVAVH